MTSGAFHPNIAVSRGVTPFLSRRTRYFFEDENEHEDDDENDFEVSQEAAALDPSGRWSPIMAGIGFAASQRQRHVQEGHFVKQSLA